MKYQSGIFEDSPYSAEWFEADQCVEHSRWEIITYHKNGWNPEWEDRLYQKLNPNLFLEAAQ